jgi:metallophosphoesterase (TIGR00282 family)
MITLLFLGDVFGRPGRDLVRRGLDALVERYAVDLVIANGENSAGGFGVTREVGDSLLEAGIDVLTSGNHIWDKKETVDYIGAESRLLRPANYPSATPGRGSYVARTADGRKVGILNLMGRVFMPLTDDPFAVAAREIEALTRETRVIVVDFHAEATSEKQAMGWFLDGRVTVLVGTHTHVQTADERILPGGTAYISDVGMTGPHDSIIGMDRALALDRFRTGMPVRMEPATENPRLNGVVITADERTGKADTIVRLNFSMSELERLPLDARPFEDLEIPRS